MNLVRDALAYPLRKHGWHIMVVSTIVWLLMSFTLAIPLVNLGLLVVYVGYFGSYYLSIISETVNGNDTMPNWPDLTNVVDGVIKPLMRLAVIVVNTWLPLILVRILQHRGVHVPYAVELAALAYGVMIWPMTALLVQVSGRWRAGLPHIVIPAIVEMGWTYVLVALACFGMHALWKYGLPAVFGRTPAYAVLIMAGLLYILAFQARITGLLYRVARAREENEQNAENDTARAE